MKKAFFSVLVIAIAQLTFAQTNKDISIDGEGDYVAIQYPPASVSNGITMWCGEPISNFVTCTGFILEGRILTDSLSRLSGNICNYHKVLLLKNFKGVFSSDTVIVVTFVNARKNDVAIFWADKINSEIFVQKYMEGCGFITVCDKKDIEKNVYEPIEAAVGHPYVDVHPNICATQQKPKK